MKLVKLAAHMNGTDIIVVNKIDVLREVGEWKVLDDKCKEVDLETEEKFKKYLTKELVHSKLCSKIVFSDNPEFLIMEG